MAGLGVNIDHIATVRQARQTIEPDPVWAAVEAELAGADCITFHLRKDRRHVNDRDAALLKQTVRGKLNMEMSLDEEIVAIAEGLMPTQVTLVPENRQEVTTEGGLDVITYRERIAEVTKRLDARGILVSAFVDPVPAQIEASKEVGCHAIELHTGAYANAATPPDGSNPLAVDVHQQLHELFVGLDAGLKNDLVVHAGHGLTYQNVAPVASMVGFDEFNIGHSLIAHALFVGIRQAVAEMKQLLS